MRVIYEQARNNLINTTDIKCRIIEARFSVQGWKQEGKFDDHDRIQVPGFDVCCCKREEGLRVNTIGARDLHQAVGETSRAPERVGPRCTARIGDGRLRKERGG